MRFRIKTQLDWNANPEYILQTRFLYFFWFDAWTFKYWVFQDKDIADTICRNMNKKVRS